MQLPAKAVAPDIRIELRRGATSVAVTWPVDDGARSVGAEMTEGAATASGGHNSVAMLVRQEGETLNELLKRLDKAIVRFYEHDEFIDEINGE
ncbi:MAG: hypothetical protein K2Q97_05930 [Burkholderiaceae bacterium]|nr:hypothetical protein [Burkholderiaceae bacterium]